MPELIQRNVVIIPPRDVWPGILAKSKDSQTLFDGYFKLSNRKGKPMPHVSLYQAAYPITVPDLWLKDAIDKAAFWTRPFTVSMARRVSLFAGEWVWWSALKSKQLVRLHNELVSGLNRWRCGKLLPIHKELLKSNTLSKQHQRSLRLYGGPLCKDAFAPHITLTRSKEPVPHFSVYPFQLMAYKVDSIYLTTVGEHGTCPEILEEFPLRG